MRSRQTAGARPASRHACAARSTAEGWTPGRLGRRLFSPCCQSPARRCFGPRRSTGPPRRSRRRCPADDWMNRRSSGCLPGARRRLQACHHRPAECAAPDGQRRAVTLRRQPQYQLHQHLQLRLQVLRVLEGKHGHNLGHDHMIWISTTCAALREAWDRGATEVCLQGGIYPDYTGATYLAICRAIKAACPICTSMRSRRWKSWHGASTLGLSLARFPGATERSRTRLAAGHRGGNPRRRNPRDHLPRQDQRPPSGSTSSSRPPARAAHHRRRSCSAMSIARVWARHLLRLARSSTATGGFTEFVPLPFVHMEAPIYLQGQARKGPTSARRC